MNFAQRVYAAAAKVDGMLTSATVTHVAGGRPVTAMVGFSESSEMVLAGEVIAAAPAIKFASADLPLLGVRDTVVIGSRTFTVATPPERLGDGGESRATLAKA